MGVRVWTFITQGRGVCVRAWVKWMQHSDACACHYEATLFVLIHICSVQSFRVTEGSRRAHECIERVQRVKPNLPSGVCSYVHFNRRSWHFLLIRQNLSLSLSPVSVSFVLFLRHHSHLTLSRSLHFPSCSLCIYLSPLMRCFFLIKSSL